MFSIICAQAFLDITESQNPSMAGVGRALWGSPSPTPLPKQGHLEQDAQDIFAYFLAYNFSGHFP